MLHAPGVLAVPCLGVALLAREHALLLPFALTILLSLGLGQAGYRMRHRDGEEVPNALRLAGLAVAWLLAAAIATVPFAWAGQHALTAEASRAYGTPLSAFFEAVSGLTGTGLTMSEDPSGLPHALQFWRSVLEWAGGIGIVLLAALFLHPGVKLKPLYESEIHIGTPSGSDPSRVAMHLLLIYAGLTAAASLAFLLAGMPAWEALNHGITGLSTGGFSVNADSFANYSATIKVIGAVVIFVGATSFAVHYRLLVERDARALRSRQLGLFVALAALITVAVAVLDGWLANEMTFADALFNTLSALGTCGFNSVPVSAWHPVYVPLLTIAMVLGAQLGSTGGGIKLERVVEVARGVARGFLRLPPSTSDLSEEERMEQIRSEHAEFKRFWQAAVVVLLYFVTLGLGTFALLLSVRGAVPFIDVFFEAASALSNVGLSTGLTGPDLAPFGRVVLIGLMWAGRLELLSLVVLLLLPIIRPADLTVPNTPAPPLTPAEEAD
jgi:trk system potassium uptake protein TrkH